MPTKTAASFTCPRATTPNHAKPKSTPNRTRPLRAKLERPVHKLAPARCMFHHAPNSVREGERPREPVFSLKTKPPQKSLLLNANRASSPPEGRGPRVPLFLSQTPFR